ncbi:hypothetical protein CFD26_107639 [Aspergillus turcosus]|uniref:Uncharacterized protein n=1 Tax=Aspergillus turcosus TaxID=1245748 RepID=A0A3R7FAW0_9EURO|nr:hypothetical protein CFD26_107639 [Aspergillus turcosus]
MKLVGWVVLEKEAFQPPRGVPAALGELRLGGSAAVSEDMTADVLVVEASSAESGGEPRNDSNMGKLGIILKSKNSTFQKDSFRQTMSSPILLALYILLICLLRDFSSSNTFHFNRKYQLAPTNHHNDQLSATSSRQYQPSTMGKIERKSLKGSTSSENSQGNKKKTPRQGSTEAIDPRNVTSFREDQKDWSWDNLPAILYQFKPTKEEETKEREPPKMKVLGGKRSRGMDASLRMHKDFAIERNALQQRNVRFRKAFHLVAWSSGNKITCQLEQEVLKKMSERGIDPSHNTTRGLTPGLIKPELGEAGGRIALPDNYGPDRRGHRGPRTPKKKRNAAKVEEDVDMDNLDPATPIREYQPLTPPQSMPGSSVKPGSSFGESAASEESMTTILSPPSPVSSPPVSYSPILSSPVLSAVLSPVGSPVPGSPVLTFTVPEEDVDSPLEETLHDGDLCPCNFDFLLKGESRQNLDWQRPCEEELSGLHKDVPKVLKARHRHQLKRQHKAFKKALPFCNTDSLYAKFASKFDLDDMVNVVPISHKTAPPSSDRLPPSFSCEPMKMRLTFNPHTHDEGAMNWTYAVALNQYYAGQRFLFEMPYVEGVM